MSTNNKHETLNMEKDKTPLKLKIPNTQVHSVEMNYDLHEQAMNWEASRELDRQKSEKKAWRVATGACVLAGLLVIAIIIMIPLKTSVPYVIHHDKTTGETSLLTAMDETKVEFGEMTDKHWLNDFILAHESYDWYTLQKDYDDVMVLSSPKVAKEYDALFTGEDALDKKYTDKVKISVDVISIIPNSNGIATIRYTKTMKRLDDQGQGIVNHWVATVAYEYHIDTKRKEKDRIANPPGFRVTSLRNDPEMMGSNQ